MITISKDSWIINFIQFAGTSSARYRVVAAIEQAMRTKEYEENGRVYEPPWDASLNSCQVINMLLQTSLIFVAAVWFSFWFSFFTIADIIFVGIDLYHGMLPLSDNSWMSKGSDPFLWLFSCDVQELKSHFSYPVWLIFAVPLVITFLICSAALYVGVVVAILGALAFIGVRIKDYFDSKSYERSLKPDAPLIAMIKAKHQKFCAMIKIEV